MKIISHGVFYFKKITVTCDKCDCKYEIKEEDIKNYKKPKKVTRLGIDSCYTEKYYHYTNCPECNYDNEINDRDYEILTFKNESN